MATNRLGRRRSWHNHYVLVPLLLWCRPATQLHCAVLGVQPPDMLLTESDSQLLDSLLQVMPLSCRSLQLLLELLQLLLQGCLLRLCLQQGPLAAVALITGPTQLLLQAVIAAFTTHHNTEQVTRQHGDQSSVDSSQNTLIHHKTPDPPWLIHHKIPDPPLPVGHRLCFQLLLL